MNRTHSLLALAVALAALTPTAGLAADAPAKKKPAAAAAADRAKAPTGAAPTESPAAAAGDKGAVSPPPAGSSPMADLKKSNAALDKALQKSRPNWSPEAELQRSEVRKIVGSFLDYGELAR